MRRSVIIICSLFSFGQAAQAQIIRSRGINSQPVAAATLGAGLQQDFRLVDGSTGAVWRFGDALQFVAAFDRVISGGFSLGVKGSTARTPVRVESFTASALSADADANVSQIAVNAHAAGTSGFHSVLDLSLGATLFSNFRERATGAKIGPSGIDTDFHFAFGYGFGYSLSPRFAIDVVQDLTTVLHQSTGLNAGDSRTSRINTTRLTARFGLGGR